MPERTATCGEDGSKTTLPDGDWNTVQQPALQTWEHRHGQEAHDGEDFSSILTRSATVSVSG